jgi:glycine/D-amino acid oxidase-like deaminating enzyme/nitrite reductase/ring-hydroxylating ferredoxin subunit
MNANDENSASLWMSVKVAPDAPRLTKNETAGVAVVGSGIAGLSAAYELSLQGHDVVVVDRGAIGGGMTARTSAHLASDCDDGFATLNRARGVDGGKIFHQSHAAAIDRIEQVQNEEAISCNFARVNGYLFPGPGTDAKLLDEEVEAGRKAGMPVERHRGLPFKGLSDVRCLRYPRQAVFHPQRYLRGLVEALSKRGTRFYADSPVMEVSEQDAGVEIKTQGGAKVSADYAVVATNSPANDWVEIHSKQAPYRSYTIALTMPKGAIEDALYWDTLDPYHYVRLQTGPGQTDYVIVGGADHKTGEADDGDVRCEALEAWIRGLLPDLGNVTHRWSGQVLEPVDYAAYSGRNPGNKRVFVHTGDSGQGLTHGVAGALLISQLIVTGKSDWAEFYEPSRKPISGTKRFIAENITAVKNFAEYIAPGEIDSADELQAGQGAIIREGLSKAAVYRDEDGKLHRRSAKCTHLGCHLHWNSLERCWDCPCHGSHFGTDGEVLNGPALAPLGKA